ncbi:GNAT family N-acetyltransferase [Kineococcus rubinsiae]|uniref:GNAT family N-acetyltransferase n=1 Tax=Kineococcus rubinsiae TaxID=2609562 RepID=UPI00142F85C0|nr:GNAT family N-acetyltransferase [Kineococcus rubinsiae]NIZ89950.1 GNAT family N-acetyltransferase [Kineococcus rubinsiae]
MARAAVEVRQATGADVDDLLALYSSARHGREAAGAAADQVRDRLLRALDGDEVRVLLATVAERPVGYALLTAAPLLPLTTSTGPSIEHLHVLPQSRRRGVARALLARAATLAHAEGAEQLCCTVAPDDREYTRYMAQLGFAPVVVRRAVALPVLRRRLLVDAAVAPQHAGDVLAHRRSLRERLARGAADTQPIPAVAEEVPLARTATEPPPAGGRRPRRVRSVPSGF